MTENSDKLSAKKQANLGFKQSRRFGIALIVLALLIVAVFVLLIVRNYTGDKLYLIVYTSNQSSVKYSIRSQGQVEEAVAMAISNMPKPKDGSSELVFEIKVSHQDILLTEVETYRSEFISGNAKIYFVTMSDGEKLHLDLGEQSYQQFLDEIALFLENKILQRLGQEKGTVPIN